MEMVNWHLRFVSWVRIFGELVHRPWSTVHHHGPVTAEHGRQIRSHAPNNIAPFGRGLGY